MAPLFWLVAPRGLWKSSFDLNGRFCFHLLDPNTSSPSKWGILNVHEEPNANLVTITTICGGSLNWLALCNRNSFLFNPISEGPPTRKHNTMQIAWKFTHSHLRWQHTSKHLFSQIVGAKCCGLSPIDFKSTC
jgi:hypothetical protein